MRYSNYDVSLAGQTQSLYEVIKGVSDINNTKRGYGLGVFYWEPAWIGPDSSTWGTYGSGWASSVSENYERLFSSTANEYSTTDQGSSWDNMTLFDADGKATSALYVFNDVLGKNSTVTGK